MPITPHEVTVNPEGSTNFTDLNVKELLSADAINKIKNNGVIQLANQADLGGLPLEVKIAYVGSTETNSNKKNSLYLRGDLGAWIKIAGGSNANDWDIDDIVNAIIRLEPAVGTVQMYWGSHLELEPGWYICNGTNGTPDLRGRVPVGVSNEAEVNSGAGAVSGITGVGHRQKFGNTSHTLTAAQSGRPASSVSVTGKTAGSNGGTGATVYAPYHNHYQWRTQKTAANGTGKSFYSFSRGNGEQQARNSIYREDGANWAIGGSTGAPPFYGSNMTSTGTIPAANATASFNLAQPSLGLHFIMYKGVS